MSARLAAFWSQDLIWDRMVEAIQRRNPADAREYVKKIRETQRKVKRAIERGDEEAGERAADEALEFLKARSN